jgi:hypothetical protein
LYPGKTRLPTVPAVFVVADTLAKAIQQGAQLMRTLEG